VSREFGAKFLLTSLARFQRRLTFTHSVRGPLMKSHRHLALFGLLVTFLCGGVSHGDTVRRVAAGVNHTLTLKEDGTLWSWGYNNYGQLGIGSTVDQWFPAQVSALSNVVAVAGGTNHSVAAKTDGTVWAWVTMPMGSLGMARPPIALHRLRLVD
jgi:alpha-tubulin suppressor-like RCC1 family protein